MFRSRINIFLSIILFAGASCNNEDSFDCFKTTGDQIEQVIPVESFHTIEIWDGMDVFLKSSTREEITLRAGENLIPKLKIVVENDTLKLSNENKCNWTRKYNPIEIYVSAPYIKEIIHRGYGKIVTQDTLRTEALKMFIQWSSADINLVVDAKFVRFVSNSLSNTVLSGKVDQLHVGHYFNDGIFNSEDLISKDVYVDHKGYANIRVRAEDSLTGTIDSNGRLEYYSKDATVSVEVLGLGQLIHLGL